jgi:ankyrin repeat protein
VKGSEIFIGRQLSFMTLTPSSSARLMTTVVSRNRVQYLNSVDDEGRTPLMLAVKKQNLYIVKHLIGKGADKSFSDKVPIS